MFKTKIINIESEFQNVWRITTEDGLILDIFETDKPQIGSIFEYGLNITDIEDVKLSHYTVMNGIIFDNDSKSIKISCGGLLGSVPKKNANNLRVNQKISLIYELI